MKNIKINASCQILLAVISVDNLKFKVIDDSMLLPDRYKSDINVWKEYKVCEYDGCDVEKYVYDYCIPCAFSSLFFDMKQMKYKSGIALFSPDYYEEIFHETGQITMSENIAKLHKFQPMDLCDVQRFINTYDGKCEGISCKVCFDSGLKFEDAEYCECDAGINTKHYEENDIPYSVLMDMVTF